MKKISSKTSLFLIFFFVCVFSVFSQQNAPVTTIGSVSNINYGTQVSLPVTVSNFNSIGAVTLKMMYNKHQLTYLSASNINTAMAANMTVANNPLAWSQDSSCITVVWSDINGLSLANSSKLFDLNFTFNEGPVATIEFDNLYSSSSNCEFANTVGDVLNDSPTETYYNNGHVYENCHAAFTYNVDNLGNVHFYDNSYLGQDSLNHITQWIWLFNTTQGTIQSILQNPVFDLNNAYGPVGVHFNIYSSNGCNSVASDSLIIENPVVCNPLNAPVTAIGLLTAATGSQISVPVTAKSCFNNIGAMTLRLYYNPTQLTFVSTSNLNSTISANLTLANNNVNATSAYIAVIWSDINGATLADSSKLFDANFIFNSGPATISFDNVGAAGSNCEFANVIGDVLNDSPTNTYYINGTITPDSWQQTSCHAGFNYSVNPNGTIATLNGFAFNSDSLPLNVTSWTWLVSNSFTMTGQNTSFTANTPGVYQICLSIQTTDSCTSTFCDSILIGEINPCNFYVIADSIRNATTSSSNDGAIYISTHNGTAPFSYFWTNGSQTEDITNLSPGNYRVTATDASGCTSTQYFNLIVQDSVPPTTTNCLGASQFVTGTFVTYPAGVNTGTAETGPNYGCLGTQENPAWYYGQVTQSGNIDLSINSSPAYDIDFACWGPFTNLNNACNQISSGGSNPVDCSYSTSSVENCNIPNTQVGQYYIFLFTNFSNQACNINFSQFSGTGSFGSLIQDTTFQVLVNTINATNSGTCNGSAYFNITGGTAPYQYYLGNQALSSDSITGLCVGTYSIFVIDTNGISTSATFIISGGPCNLSLSDAITNVAAGTDSTGAINITVSGGSPPYTYLWYNGMTSENIMNLPVGIYPVTVTDATDCAIVDCFYVGTDSSQGSCLAYFTFNVDGSGNVHFFDQSNGGSDPIISWNWSFYSNQYYTSHLQNPYIEFYNFNGVAHGTLTITTSNGCTSTYYQNFMISNPCNLSLSAVITPSISNTNGTGAINLSVTGGTPSYFYNWNDNYGTQDRNNLTNGYYSVTVTDANDCNTTGSYYVNLDSVNSCQANFTYQLDSSGNLYFYDQSVLGTNPSAQITSYEWWFSLNYNMISTSNEQNPVINVSNLTGLISAYLNITTSTGCNSSFHDSLIIGNPCNLSLSAVITNVTAGTTNTGAINLTVTGGNPPYTYLWYYYYSTTPVIQNLPMGYYSVTVTDNYGCAVVDSFYVGTDSLQSSCQANFTYSTDSLGNTYFYDQSTVGTDSIISWNWTFYKTDSSFYSNNSFQNPVIQFYTNGQINASLQITTLNGCSSTYNDTLVVEFLCDFAISSANVTPVAYGTVSTGAISLNVTGGTEPIHYITWSNGAQTPSINNLAVGTYSVTLFDANSCTASGSYYVWYDSLQSSCQANFTYSTDSSENVHFYDQSIGGTDSSVYITSYNWSFYLNYGLISNSSEQNPVINTSNLSGEMVVYLNITTSIGCNSTFSNSFFVNPCNLSLSATITNVAAGTTNTGAISLNVAGGTPPFAYLWYNGMATQNVSYLPVGIYPISVTDANGCAVVDSFYVGTDSVQNFCNASFVFNHDGIGGVHFYDQSTVGSTPTAFITNWNWSFYTTNGTIYSSSTEQNPYIHFNYNGQINAYLNITTSTGCTSSYYDTLFVSIYCNLSIASANITPVAYGTVSTGAISLNVTGGTLPYHFDWGIGVFLGNISNLSVGNYSVIVTDANACTASGTYYVWQNNTQPTCTGLTNLFNPSGTFSDGSGANKYMNNADCRWLIQDASMTPIPSKIQLGFTTFITELGVDKVRVFDGTSTSSPLLAEFSGNLATMPTIMSTTGVMLVQFISDSAINFAGWDAYYIFIHDSIPVCNLAATYSVTPVSVINGNDGSVDVTVTTGISPYIFAWSNGAVTEDLNGIGAGVYTVTITEANTNCAALILNATLYQPYDPNGGAIVDTLYTGAIDTCFASPVDSFYVSQVVVNTNNTVTVTWGFVCDGIIYFIVANYSFSSIGNQVIYLTLNCNNSKRSANSYLSYIHINTINNVAELSLNNDLIAYPIPMNEILYIEMNLEKQSDVTINVQNIEGQVVYQKNIIGISGRNIWNADVQHLAAGFYFLDINVNGNRKAVRKLVK